MAAWETKAWGSVHHIFASDYAAVSCLNVVAGTRCSIHYHEHRHNQFYVMSGKIVVEVWDDTMPQYMDDVHGLAPSRHHLLQPSNNPNRATIVVPARKLHRFRVIETGNIVEVYWTFPGRVVSLEDIVRFDEGGKDDQSDLKSFLETVGV